MAALLAEQDSLDLDVPLSTHFPELEFDSPSLFADRISLRDHLVHRAGYENQVLGYRPPSIGRLPVDEVIRVTRGYSNSRPITFHYSNEAYIVTGAGLSRTTGVFWKTLLKNRIFAPLGMEQSTSHISEAKQGEFAAPHALRNGEVTTITAKSDANMHAA